MQYLSSEKLDPYSRAAKKKGKMKCPSILRILENVQHWYYNKWYLMLFILLLKEPHGIWRYIGTFENIWELAIAFTPESTENWITFTFPLNLAFWVKMCHNLLRWSPALAHFLWCIVTFLHLTRHLERHLSFLLRIMDDACISEIEYCHWRYFI